MSADLGRFRRLGIRTDADLLLHLPLRYEDETRVVPIAEVRAGGPCQVAGEVVHAEVLARPRRMLQVELDDGTGRIALRFLHFYASQVAQLAVGRRVRAHGEVRGGLFGLEMVHPRYRMTGPAERLPVTLTPVYPTVHGIGQAELRRAILDALAAADWPDTLRPGVAERLGLPPLMPSLRLLHQPTPDVPLSAIEDRTHPACRRLAFEELLAQQLSLRRARAARARQRAQPLRADAGPARLLGALPFALTGAQRRAWAEISHDLAGAEPMNRLLQGDVGSGKTVVAALAAMQAIGNGRQAALMAPTEILAEQHHRKLGPWLEPLGVRVAWLAGSLTPARKRRVREAAAAGEVDLLVGTHALVEESVELPALGLAIVDEQHRFGVVQRGLLADKGLHPDVLLMTATPIPRTLALTACGDMDVSIMRDRPPGRQPVQTLVRPESRRDEIYGLIRHEVKAGRQVYVVYPIIESSEKTDLKAATTMAAHLTEDVFPDLRVALLHGRLKSDEKEDVMRRFSQGAIDVLVSTTVIEVGVDVPNATVMVIEHAERFGLAQLHQLRGRVGRGKDASRCWLLC
ncbi:MAG TPA: ATP-dependent DNA helicase RecG, partial [Burkholderiaceae bacterium]|nr:ATP-dependent DNA helicase RecG [Burkholderiaceae bacterium]